METEGVTFSTDPKKERVVRVTEVMTSTFTYGVLVGCLICLSVLGLLQQAFQNYQPFFYSDNIYSVIREMWVHAGWYIWVVLIAFTILYGKFCFRKVKWRMLKTIHRNYGESRSDN